MHTSDPPTLPLFVTLRSNLSFFSSCHVSPQPFLPPRAASRCLCATMSSFLSSFMRLFLVCFSVPLLCFFPLSLVSYPYYCHYIIRTSTSASAFTSTSKPVQSSSHALADEGVAWTLASLDPPFAHQYKGFTLNWLLWLL